MLIFSVSFQFYRMILEGNPSQTSVQRDRKRNEEKNKHWKTKRKQHDKGECKPSDSNLTF